MLYLGGLRAAGVLTYGHEAAAPADYDFDGFLTKNGLVTGSGEIRMSPKKLRDTFGRKDLQLRTQDGRLLSLQFSDNSCVQQATPPMWMLPADYCRPSIGRVDACCCDHGIARD